MAFLAAQVLHEVDKQIIAADLCSDIPDISCSIVSPTPLGSGKFIGASYVDDTFSRASTKALTNALNICNILSIVIDVIPTMG